MTDAFLLCVPLILKHEGGYVDHPRDPGGCTNFGITCRTLEGWRRQPTGCEDVRRMDVSEARAIYRAHYWNAVRGDDMPAGVNLVVFDAAVNSGRRRSVEWLQSAVGADVDGAIGPQTLRAVRRVNDRAELIRRVCANRMTFLRSLETWDDFGRGWTRRVTDIQTRAISMAVQQN